MEKDQNTNSETQNNEAEEIKAEELNNDLNLMLQKITNYQKKLLLRKKF